MIHERHAPPSRTVGDVMTRAVVTFSPDATLREATAILAEKQISGAPVCKADGIPLGVITTIDLVGSYASRARATRVREVMTPSVVSVPADTSLADAVRLMAVEGVHRLVVLERGDVVGIVTVIDVLRALAGYGRADSRDAVMAPSDADAP